MRSSSRQFGDLSMPSASSGRFRSMWITYCVKLVSLKKLRATVIDFSRPLIWCHQFAGVNNVSPGSMTHS